MRRVITGVDADGRAVLEVDEPTPTVEFGPGFAVTDLWRVEDPPTSPMDGEAPTSYSFEPAHGGAVFRVVTIPPDEVVEASIAAGEKWGRNSPYRRTGEDYGLHATATQDYVTVISGRVDLRLPDGDQVRLGPGDVVVQRGAAHAWRNPGPDPLVLHVVMLGGSPPDQPDTLHDSADQAR